MFARNRISAFINTLVFLSLYLTIYALVNTFSEPRVTDQGFSLNAWVIVLLVLVLLGIAYACSRSVIVTGLGEIGLGWQGLLRWSICGVVTGGLVTLYYAFVLNRLKEGSFILNLLELPGTLGIAALVYWLVFRRNLFTVGGKTQHTEESLRYLGWFFMIGGGIVTMTGWAVLLFKNGLAIKDLLMSSSTIMMGLASILMGGIIILQPESRRVGRFLWPVAGLILVAVGLFAVTALIR